MPANFPEVWLKRVRQNLTSPDSAPWLDGIAELDAPVTELGAGSDSESNIIHVPTTTFKPDVLINNTTYPIAIQQYTDSELTIQLDKYQTKIVSLSDDQVIGASYDRIDAASRTTTSAMIEKKFAKAIHALAPASNATATPILTTTGTATATGRLRLTYEDLVALKDLMDTAGISKVGRRLVPSSLHYNDMLLDRKNFGDQLVNYKAGTLAPMIAGFQIYQPYETPYYLNGAKVPFASAPGAGAKQATVAFAPSNVAKRTGLTKQYYSPAAANPTTQTNLWGIRHYFIALPYGNEQIGAVISGDE